MEDWLIYGANGYTGELIALKSVASGMRPILAGRNKEEIRPLAESLGLSHRIFSLQDADVVKKHIGDVAVVLHCAGPFSKTAPAMMQACLESGAHYLDITGEIAVFEAAQRLAKKAEENKVVLCPGVGMDVIPTDCVAAQLKLKMPDATRLKLGIDFRGSLSRGTAKTSVEGAAKGGKIRKEGEILTVPLAHKQSWIDFGNGEKFSMTIPWGDVSTAYWTTGIPNIEVYISTTRKAFWALKALNYIRALLGLGWVQRMLKKRIDQRPRGPTGEQRKVSRTHIWGEVKNRAGQKLCCRITIANGYDVTVDGSIACVSHLLNEAGVVGTLTPSQLLGPDLIETLPGSTTFVFGVD